MALLLFLVRCCCPSWSAWRSRRVDDAYYREALANAGGYFGAGYYVVCVAAALLTLYFMFERRFDGSVSSASVGLVTVSRACRRWSCRSEPALQQEPIKEAALLCRERGYRRRSCGD